MNIRAVFALALLLSLPAFAQAVDPLQNVSGTTANPGFNPWVTATSGGWTIFHGFDAHVTYMSQTGPAEQENDIISTNWFGAGLKRELGDRGFILARGRVSLEEYTIPEDGYLQFFQYTTDEAGLPLTIDRMRPHDVLGEAAVQVGWRPTDGSLVSVYGALVGQPALGAAPAELRASGVDFAEAPFAYDVQETYSDSTSVVTAGFSTRWIAVEASAFHDAFNQGDDGFELDTDDIDSHSARVTLMSNNFALQVSRGELGDDDSVNQRTVTSGSFTYSAPMVAATALWTRREYETARAAETAYGFELALRGSRNTFMARVEHVDRPAGFPGAIQLPLGIAVEPATHFTGGYIFDFIAGSKYRVGAGVNVDYRTQTRELEDTYGHKPQGIFAFVRARTGN
jgi:hypothetical protein